LERKENFIQILLTTTTKLVKKGGKKKMPRRGMKSSENRQGLIQLDTLLIKWREGKRNRNGHPMIWN